MIIFILFTLLLSYILFYISIEDIKTMLISEFKLRIFAASGICYLILLGISNEHINGINLIISNSYSMIIVFLIMYSISYTSYKIFRINSLGMGDIKLSSISAIWLGSELCILSLYISFFLSAIYSLYGKVNKSFKPFHQYPFAPFLSIGIFCSWILNKIELSNPF